MKEIIIFGTGEIGKSAISYLKNEYNILFLVDNDCGKWGNYVDGYIIESPKKIKNYDYNIVVASTKYRNDIVKQLWNMGVNKDKIYLYNRYLRNTKYECEIYPVDMDMQKLIGTGKKLQEYDLMNTVESSSNRLKVMIFCISYSVYAKQLIENMYKRYDDIEFSLVTTSSEYQKNIPRGFLAHIYCFSMITDLKTILDKIPMYDAMQFLWIENIWTYFAELIRSKTKQLNLNVGGSEFYRTENEDRDYKRKLIAIADKVTAETEGTVQDFASYYDRDVQDKMGLLPFGIEVLDYIKLCDKQDRNELKRKYHILVGKIVITCGHNAGEAHQHKDIIDALEKLSEPIKQKVVCVFPMTYPNGREKYISEVDDRLNESGLEYLILTDFMDFQSMAEYALISDIMIHVQTTDQLSSTMLEEMYAGSVVIAGSWLPYQSLHEMGIYFLDVDTIPNVTAVLEDVVTNIESYKKKCIGNSEIVWKHSSWDELAPKWRALWD